MYAAFDIAFPEFEYARTIGVEEGDSWVSDDNNIGITVVSINHEFRVTADIFIGDNLDGFHNAGRKDVVERENIQVVYGGALSKDTYKRYGPSQVTSY